MTKGERVDHIAMRRAACWRTADIAAELGLHQCTVAQICRDFNIPRPKVARLGSRAFIPRFEMMKKVMQEISN